MLLRLNGEERDRLEALIRKGKGPARQVLKARILLKADVSQAGDAERAKEAEHERDTLLARYHNYELASAAFQIGMVLCSAAVITGCDPK